jgi:leukotriene-A4 hydrolase
MISSLLIALFLINASITKDTNTFSNYEIIQQTRLEANFNIDFDQKVIHGQVKLYLNAIKDGEVIVLDTRALSINSVIDSDTGEELEFVIDKQYDLDANGVPLKIYKEYSKGDNIAILIYYDTTDGGSAVQFLDKEQTTGKQYPFMFTQCESILTRELLPIQDTPAVKITTHMGLTVPKPLFALDSGIYQSKIDNGNSVTYFYEQKIPIPSYLIALAAGAIEERVISDRSKVYGEKELVDLAAEEFDGIENFIQIAEAYVSPYVWGEYNLLILPSSFPFGGMENPTLTFVTPSLLAGDKSLANVVAHEISHSWSGNLVTMDNWSDFWLNEGFTMFLQRKIMEKTDDIDLAKLDAMVLYNTLVEDIQRFGESKSFSSLRPYLVGRHADDAFSEVPYEKGFNFLYFLETIVNKESDIDLFRKILRQYFAKFAYKSLKTDDFQNFFIETIKAELPDKADNILNQIDWVQWIDAPGYPPVKNDFSNKYANEVKEAVDQFYNGNLPDTFVDTFKKWHTLLKQYFLNNLKETDKVLGEYQLNKLNNDLNLKEGYNAEVNFGYYMVILLHAENLEDTFKTALNAFLGKFGRLKYLRPLYRSYYVRDKEAALSAFNEWKGSYHPIAVRMIELDFKSLE